MKNKYPDIKTNVLQSPIKLPEATTSPWTLQKEDPGKTESPTKPTTSSEVSFTKEASPVKLNGDLKLDLQTSKPTPTITQELKETSLVNGSETVTVCKSTEDNISDPGI